MTRSHIVNGIDLAEHNGLVGRIVNRYRRFIGGVLAREDRVQAGWMGLRHAATRFDHSRGQAFSTYSMWWIRTFIQRCIANERRTVRVPVHAQTDAYKRGERIPLDTHSLDAPIDGGSGDTFLDFVVSQGADPEQSTLDRDLKERIDAAIDQLPARDRRIVRMRVWGEHTLALIGDEEGVSRERIRQREEAALKRLARLLDDE